MPFFESRATFRVLRGGNQTSKTLGCAIEVARWARGIQLAGAWRPIPRFRGRKLTILVASLSFAKLGEVAWNKLGRAGAYYKYRFDCPKCGKPFFGFPSRRPITLMPGIPDGDISAFEGWVQCPCGWENSISDLPADYRWEAPPLIPDNECAVTWEERGKDIPSCVETRYAKLLFRSADSGRAKFQGGQYDLIWNDEELGPESDGVFEEEVRGMMARRGAMIWSATPLAKQPALIDLHDRVTAKDGDVSETVLGLGNNHHLPAKVRDTTIKTWPREQRRTRVYGDFLLLQGLVYGEWNPAVHCIPRFNIDESPKDWTWFRSIDPGLGKTAVLWFAVDRYGDYVIADELLLDSANLERLVREIREKDGNRYIVDTVIDPSDQKSLTCPEGLRVLLSRYGIPCHSAFGRDVNQGIFRVKEDLVVKPERNRPRCVVFNDLMEFRREISRYRRGDDRPTADKSDDPVKRNDHFMDAWRYRVMAGLRWVPERAIPAPKSPVWAAFQRLERKMHPKTEGVVL